MDDFAVHYSRMSERLTTQWFTSGMELTEAVKRSIGNSSDINALWFRRFRVFMMRTMAASICKMRTHIVCGYLTLRWWQNTRAEMHLILTVLHNALICCVRFFFRFFHLDRIDLDANQRSAKLKVH